MHTVLQSKQSIHTTHTTATCERLLSPGRAIFGLFTCLVDSLRWGTSGRGGVRVNGLAIGWPVDRVVVSAWRLTPRRPWVGGQESKHKWVKSKQKWVRGVKVWVNCTHTHYLVELLGSCYCWCQTDWSGDWRTGCLHRDGDWLADHGWLEWVWLMRRCFRWSRGSRANCASLLDVKFSLLSFRSCCDFYLLNGSYRSNRQKALWG